MAWSALIGAVGAGVAVLFLGPRCADDGSFLVGFGLAVVGFVLSVGMFGWVYVSDADGDSLCTYPATVTSASVLMVVAAGNNTQRTDVTPLSVALVGGAVLIIIGYSLVFVQQVWETSDSAGG